jgi:hypothetical protein
MTKHTEEEIERAVRRAEQFDPTTTPMEDATDLRAIAEAADAVQAAQARLREAVEAARLLHDRSWGRIGIALGVSRQSARERFGDGRRPRTGRDAKIRGDTTQVRAYVPMPMPRHVPARSPDDLAKLAEEIAQVTGDVDAFLAREWLDREDLAAARAAMVKAAEALTEQLDIASAEVFGSDT